MGKENQRLRRELEDLRKKRNQEHVTAVGSGQQTQHAPGRRVLGEISANKAVRGEREDLEKSYTSLAKRYASLEARYDVKQQTANKFKSDVRQWTRYAEYLEGKLNKAEKRLEKMNAISAPASSEVANPTVTEASGEETAASNASFSSTTEPGTRPAAHQNTAERPRLVWRETSAPSISTPDVPTPTVSRPLAVAQQPCQPETNILDEMDYSHAGHGLEDACQLPILLPPQELDRHFLVKQEPLSDEPVVVSERALRKRKNDEDHDGEEPPSRRIKNEQGNSSDPVVTGELTAFLPQESLDLDAGHGSMPTPKKQRHRPEEYLNEEEKEEEEGAPVDGRTTFKPLSREAGAAEVPNNHKSVTAHDHKLSHGVTEVAEDGTEFPSSLPPAREVSDSRASQQGRLQALLNDSSAEPGAVILRPIGPGRNSPRMDTFELDLMALRTERKKQEEAASTRTPAREPVLPKANSSSLNSRLQRDAPQTKAGLLRKRPLAELRVEDFKINPKYNNGYKHAFAEVVRDKAGRAELSGCIDPNCCGKKFGAIAQSELDNGGPGILEGEDNVKLLEDYLGDEAYRLIGMTSEDKQKLWLDAKTRDLANKFGRHRQRYTRMQSPPGFWDPDFPSTQEVERRREEGQKLERGIIEERWREALRGGGRWLFRDE